MLNLDDFKESIKTPISIKNLIKKGGQFLINSNISNGRNELEWYMQHLYNCDKINLFQISNNIVNNYIYNKALHFIIDRSQKIPFQYIMGESTFYGRNYLVNKHTLIPRPETELIISLIQNRKCDSLVDIGTGTGCLGITAALEKISDCIDLIDINEQALHIAQKNSERFNIKNVRYFNLDILIDIPPHQYDIVISNPPYISKNEYNDLDAEVKNYEPYNALSDSADGYTFYKRYASILNEILKDQGIAIFEISHFFSKTKLLEIFKNFSNISFHKDLNGDYRAIRIIND